MKRLRCDGTKINAKHNCCAAHEQEAQAAYQVESAHVHTRVANPDEPVASTCVDAHAVPNVPPEALSHGNADSRAPRAGDALEGAHRPNREELVARVLH